MYTKFTDNNGSTFTVFGMQGDGGYKIYCVNGGWSCIYDHDMKMAYRFWEGEEDVNFYNPSTPRGFKPMNLTPIEEKQPCN